MQKIRPAFKKIPGEAGTIIGIAVRGPIVIPSKDAGIRGIIPITAPFDHATILVVDGCLSPFNVIIKIMARYDHLVIFQKSLQFVSKIYIYANRFPKAQKFVLGQRIEIAAVDLVMLIVETNSTLVEQREPLFKKMFLTLEKIKILLRLAHMLSFLSTKGYEILSTDAMELSRVLKGWEKSSANQ